MVGDSLKNLSPAEVDVQLLRLLAVIFLFIKINKYLSNIYMAINKEKKQEIVEKVSAAIDKAEAMVFVNFHGLSVADTTSARESFRQKEVGYMVAKKTLIRRAFDGRKIEGEMPELEGEVAVAYGEDVLEPIKSAYDQHKSNPDNFRILGGIFEGKFLAAEEIISLAKIPDRQTLYAQLANVLNSPLSGLAMALDQIAKKQEA
ncbi:MAG: 50S ribosomal protein L10 [Patescibacteria group bacterium]